MVLSRRVITETKRFDELAVGQSLEGEIYEITSNGCLVDLDEILGFLPRSELEKHLRQFDRLTVGNKGMFTIVDKHLSDGNVNLMLQVSTLYTESPNSSTT